MQAQFATFTNGRRGGLSPTYANEKKPLDGRLSSLTLNNTLSTGRVTEVTNGTIGNPWYSSRFNGTMAFSFTGH